MSIKVVREKVATPPVEKVIVELTPDQAKAIYLMSGNVVGVGYFRDITTSIYLDFAEVMHGATCLNIDGSITKKQVDNIKFYD